MATVKNMIGIKCGRLTPISMDETMGQSGKHVCWLCRCDCGNLTIVPGQKLRNGHTRSCGCLNVDSAVTRHFIDKTGKRYGKLTVVRQDGWIQLKSGHRRSKWLCQCSCGRTKSVSSSKLEQQTCCGCTKHSPLNNGNPDKAALLYFLRMTDGAESFCKVGITTQSLKLRYDDQEYKRFDIETIHTIQTIKEAALNLESDIKRRFWDAQYRPTTSFGGHTECFHESALLDICEYIDDMYPLSECV
jgi:hypothetical protein